MADDGGATVSASGQAEPSSPLVSSSVVMGVTAVTIAPVCALPRNENLVFPQQSPVLPKEAETKKNVDVNADENANVANEAMNATDGGGFTVVKRDRRKSERFAASPHRPLRKRVSDMSELPDTPESKKPDKLSPKERSAPAFSLEQIYTRNRRCQPGQRRQEHLERRRDRRRRKRQSGQRK